MEQSGMKQSVTSLVQYKLRVVCFAFAFFPAEKAHNEVLMGF
jgi:hypothetical protein